MQTYWGDAGAGAIIFSKESRRFMLGLRSDLVREPGTLGLIGGAIENGDTPKETVEQEMMEEVGYIGPMRLIPLKVFESENGFKYHNFLSVIENDFEPVLNHENDAAVWLSFDELIDVGKKAHFGLAELIKDQKSVSILAKISGEREQSYDGPEI